MKETTKSVLKKVETQLGRELMHLPQCSLYRASDETVIYIRYSKIHGSTKAFYGLRFIDLENLQTMTQTRKAYVCFVLGDTGNFILLPYLPYRRTIALSPVAEDGAYKVTIHLSNPVILSLSHPSRRLDVSDYLNNLAQIES